MSKWAIPSSHLCEYSMAYEYNHNFTYIYRDNKLMINYIYRDNKLICISTDFPILGVITEKGKHAWPFSGAVL